MSSDFQVFLNMTHLGVFFFNHLQMTKLLEVHLLLKNRSRTGLEWQVSFLTSGPRDVRVIHARQSPVGREFVPLPFQPSWLQSSLLTDGAIWPVAEENETNNKKNHLVEEPSSNRARETWSCRLCLEVSSVYSFHVPMPLLHPQWLS